MTTVEQILRSRSLRTEFQPIVDLVTRDVVGVEALMRGPSEGPLASPEALIAAAADEGALEDLDRLARFTALYAVARERLGGGHRLFLNSECCAPPERFKIELAVLDQMAPRIQPVLEVTERAAQQPASVLGRTVEIAREYGWRIALDDVGCADASTLLLPVVRPDFVKLDLRLVQDEPTEFTRVTHRAVQGYRKRSGATLIAEGIENSGQLETALWLGADWGQGWLLGMPSANPAPPANAARTAPG